MVILRVKGFVLCMVFFCASTLTAAVRTIEDAATIAGQVAYAIKNDISPSQITRKTMIAAVDAEPMRLAYTQMQYMEATPALYVFTHTEGGYVIVSADDRVRDVLAYSTESSFSEEDMPDNMRIWMQVYADEIAQLTDEVTAGGNQQTSVEYYPIVEPLLGNTAWNQSAPYNNHCPIDKTGERSVTGCSATATAQIMYYHQHPISGTGTHAYYWGGKELSVDFSQAVYDWANMLPDYSKEYTTEQADAVAQLMYHVGIASNMQYSSTSSGAGFAASMHGLIRNFDYDAGIEILKKDYMDEAELLAKIVADLQANRPVQIEALTKKREGHSFVCDGIHSDGYLHINWGWGGYGNGYFALSALNPDNQGVGGASDNGAFTESVTIYTGIQPNIGGDAKPLLLASEIQMNTPLAIAKNDKVSFSLIELQNAGLTKSSGAVVCMFYQNELLHNTVNTSCVWELQPNHYYSTQRKADAHLPNLAEGEYELVVGTSFDGKDIPEPIWAYQQGAKCYTVNVTNDSIFFTEKIIQGYFGTEYIKGQVTDLSAKTQKNNLRLMIQTEDFHRNNRGQVTSGSAIVLDLFPKSAESLIGTYSMGVSHSPAEATIASDYSLILEMRGGKSTTEKLVDGIATISQLKGGHYAIDYRFRSEKKSYEGKCRIMSDAIDVYRQTSSGNVHTYKLTNEIVTSMSPSQAIAQAQQLTSSESADMPYFVQGIISPEKAITYDSGVANFCISDDGTANQYLTCVDTKWLANSDFSLGNELNVNDTVIIMGNVQYSNQSVPCIQGYVFAHYPTDLSSHVTNVPHQSMKVVVEDRTITIATTEAEDIVVYDVFGRSLHRACNTTYTTFSAPQQGCYLLHSGDITRKIFIQ